MGSSERLTSPNATSVLFSNAVVTAFHAGARFRHQPHPSDAIQRTKRFFFTPDAISHVTLTSLPSLEWPRGGSTGRAISSSAGGRCSEGPCERGAGASEEGVERGACGGIRSAAGRCAVSLPLRDTTTLRHHPYARAALHRLPAPLSQPLCKQVDLGSDPPLPPSLGRGHEEHLPRVKRLATAGNRTRVARVAGEHHTTRPQLLGSDCQCRIMSP